MSIVPPIIDADFTTDTDGFGYFDDVFRGTSQPDYADGGRVTSGGAGDSPALRMELGGIDGGDIGDPGMSGGFETSFTLDQTTNVSLNFFYRLDMSGGYEADEFAEVLVSLNDGSTTTLVRRNGNEFIDRLVGDAGAATPRVVSEDTVSLDLGALTAGTYTVTLGGRNNKKTTANENTIITFDDVLVEGTLAGPPNTAPMITSGATASIAENQTTAIDVDATDDNDVEGAGLTYSLSGGADQALFDIDAATGEVSFDATPNFEAPGDANGDNDYEVQVTVTDSGGLTDVQDITITVTDVVDNSQPPDTLADLDGTNGFVLAGIDAGDQLGSSVSSAGDVNGDGFVDVIIGASTAAGRSDDSHEYTGEAYVVFGKGSGFDPDFELSSLDGANGFILAGIDRLDRTGYSVSGAGDLNGDGFADVIVGANRASGGSNNSRFDAGKSYVVFGKASGFDPVIELSSLDGTNGFALAGIDSLDLSGDSVSGAGDVNGDGFADLIIGARYATNGAEKEGESYVVFGKSTGFAPVIELSSLDGADGFVLGGIDLQDMTGRSVSSAGDVNGDGFADIVVGSFHADGGPDNTPENAGETYVIFGKASGIASRIEASSLDGTNGFTLAGIDEDDFSGNSVSGAGDINGDGFADLIVGAINADGGPDNARPGAGESYVIFGKGSAFDPVITLSSLDGTDGFALAGIDDSDSAGISVSGAGDVNGDGYDDLIVGAHDAGGGPDNLPSRAGETYVVFGKASGFGSVVELLSLDGADGFLLAGIDNSDDSGRRVSGAGDVNGDGFADLIVGARLADGGPDNARGEAGESYVVFGSNFTGAVTAQGDAGANTLTGTDDADVLIGAQGNDTLIGNGGSDVLYGGEGDDVLAISDAGPQRIKGGTGTDTLRLDGSGLTLDLTAISDLTIEQIERIDLRDGSGAHSLILDFLEVLNLSDTSNTLTVLGDAADTVDIRAGWLFHGIANGFETFTQGAATLVIDADIAVSSVNVPPVAQDDAFYTDEDRVLGFNVFDDNGNGEDRDDNGNSLTVTEVNGQAGDVGTALDVVSDGGRTGRLTIRADGELRFSPIGGFQDLAFGESDTVTVDYTASDGNGGTDTATATVTIYGENDAPVEAANVGMTVSTGGAAAILPSALAYTDVDDTAEDVIFTVTTPPANGQLEFAGAPGVTISSFSQADLDAQRLVYVHGGGADAADSFSFTVSNGHGPLVFGQSFAITVNDPPFARIEAEDYVDYLDLSPGNTGGAYRSDDVDIEATSDTGGGFNVGWTESGEWLSYLITVPEAGAYDITARIASLNPGPFSLKASVNGSETTLTFDGTGGYQTWADAVGTLVLPTSTQTLRLDVLSGGFNLNWVEFSPTSTIPPIIDADFNTGTDGFAYQDDMFRGTSEPVYADGVRAVSGGVSGSGALEVDLGGVDGADILAPGMSGGWQTSFTLATATQLTLDFFYRLDMSGSYEAEEFAEVLVSLNDGSTTTLFGQGGNAFIDRLVGDAGPATPRVVSEDTVSLDLGELAAGTYTLTLGGRNNQKTTASENTIVTFDDVLLEGSPFDPTNAPPNASDSTHRGYSLVPLTGEYVRGFDPDGDPLTVSSVNGLESNVGQAVNVVSTGGRTGQLTIGANRDLTFDPMGNFDDLQRGESDTVTVDFTISDGRGGTDTATATVIVEGAREDVAEPNDTIPQAIDTGIHPNGATQFEVASYIGNNPNISDPQDDVDFFRLEMKAGERAIIDVDDFGFEALLFDTAGFGVAFGRGDPRPDDEFWNSYIDFTAQADSVYYLGVSSHDSYAGDPLYDPFVEGSGTGSGTGPYDLSVVLTEYQRRLLDADFNDGLDGFAYVDDAFRATAQPGFADGARVDQGGVGDTAALQVSLGGINGTDIRDPGMSGGWETSFTLIEPTQVTLSFFYRLDMSGSYEADEFAQVMVSLNDGSRTTLFGPGRDFVDQLTGDGGSSTPRVVSEDTVVLDLGVQGAGTYTLTLGGRNNKKTTTSENTVLTFDDVSLDAEPFRAPLTPSDMDGTNGLVIFGIDDDDRAGSSVAGAGDVNGDGFDDVIIVAPGGDGGPGDPFSNAGEAYVVFGRASGFAPALDPSLFDGTNGFVIVASDGRSISDATGAGDINGDGFADLIVEDTVVYGQAAGFSPVVDLSSLGGPDGSGVSPITIAGDINGDGFDDIVGGDPYAAKNTLRGIGEYGEAFVVFGQADGAGPGVPVHPFTADKGFLLSGIGDYDHLGSSVSFAGDINGDGFDDVIFGADGVRGDQPSTSHIGASYVIFGGDFTAAVTRQGDDGANTFTGTTAPDTFVGAQGDDTLVGNGGEDVLYGGQGDDTLAIADASFQRIKGGTGTDTLRLDGSGFTLDLTTIADLTIEAIENIDLQEGDGAHDLTLDVLEVLNLSNTSNTLRVLGDGDDGVEITDIGAWAPQGIASGFETFTHGAAILEIDEDILIT